MVAQSYSTLAEDALSAVLQRMHLCSQVHLRKAVADCTHVRTHSGHLQVSAGAGGVNTCRDRARYWCALFDSDRLGGQALCVSCPGHVADVLAATAGVSAGSVRESLLIVVQHNCVSVCAQEVRQQAADGWQQHAVQRCSCRHACTCGDLNMRALASRCATSRPGLKQAATSLTYYRVHGLTAMPEVALRHVSVHCSIR